MGLRERLRRRWRHAVELVAGAAVRLREPIRDDGIANTYDAVRLRHEADAEPRLVIPLAVSRQRAQRLLAAGEGFRVDRGQHAAVAVLGEAERELADLNLAPAVLRER